MRWLLLGLTVCVVLAVTGIALLGLWSPDDADRPVAPPPESSGEAEFRSARTDVMLSAEKQQFIWDAEHVTFEIEQRFGKAFREHLAAMDAEALAGFFLDTFSGRLLTSDWNQTRHGPLTEQVRSGENGDAVPATQTVDELLAPLQRFATIDHHKLRVLAIDSAGPAVWDCRLLLVVTGTTESGCPVIYESEHDVRLRVEDEQQLESVASIESWDIRRQAQRESQQWLLEEVTQAVGLDRLGIPDNWRGGTTSGRLLPHWFQMAVEDFDLDGDPDLAIATANGQRLLLRNENGSFRRATEEVGLPKSYGVSPEYYSTTWIDFDNDGYPDLLSGRCLYRNVNGQSFEDVTRESDIELLPDSMSVCVADYDCDGHADFYVLYNRPTEMREGAKPAGWVNDEESGAENQLWRNLGGGKFENVTTAAAAGGGPRVSHTAVWFFHNDDNYPDLYIANDFGKNVLLQNRGDGTFEDVSDGSGADGFSTTMGIAAGDINNDGRSDLYVANMYSKMGRRIIGMVSAEDYPDDIYRQICGSCAGNRLYVRADEGYSETADGFHVNGVGWAWGPTMADFNNDGWLDLYSTTGYMSFDRRRPDG